MRPFEVGDLVLTKENGIGIVTALIANKTAIECEMQYNFYYYSVKNGIECGFSKSTTAVIFEYDNGDKIEHIRKPRAGSKEARDIVAMLAKEYRKFPLIIENELEMEFCKGIYTAYKLSKQMLERKL